MGLLKSFVWCAFLLCLSESQKETKGKEISTPTLSDRIKSDEFDNHVKDYFHYDDQTAEESALTEKQAALRSFYKRRRPTFKLKGKGETLNRIMEKIEAVNDSNRNETKTEKKQESEANKKVLNSKQHSI